MFEREMGKAQMLLEKARKNKTEKDSTEANGREEGKEDKELLSAYKAREVAQHDLFAAGEQVHRR